MAIISDVDEKRERELMQLGDEAAILFKQMCRADVPVKQAGEMASAWLISQARIICPPDDKKPWE